MLKNAYQNKKDIFIISKELIKNLKIKAFESADKRYRYCIHKKNDHLTQEMIIVFHKDTILTPHRHPKGRSESYHVIEGSMNVYFFDDDGNTKDAISLKEKSDEYSFYYRLSSQTWHLPVPTSEFMVFHETITGPFLTDKDIEYPSWKNKYNTKEKINRLINSTKIK